MSGEVHSDEVDHNQDVGKSATVRKVCRVERTVTRAFWRFLVQVSLALRKCVSHPLSFVEDLLQFQFSLTERNPKRILASTKW